MRYRLTYPIPGGEQWYIITDAEKNQDVATFFADMPHAEIEARALLIRLNSSLIGR